MADQINPLTLKSNKTKHAGILLYANFELLKQGSWMVHVLRKSIFHHPSLVPRISVKIAHLRRNNLFTIHGTLSPSPGLFNGVV